MQQFGSQHSNHTWRDLIQLVYEEQWITWLDRTCTITRHVTTRLHTPAVRRQAKKRVRTCQKRNWRAKSLLVRIRKDFVFLGLFVSNLRWRHDFKLRLTFTEVRIGIDNLIYVRILNAIIIAIIFNVDTFWFSLSRLIFIDSLTCSVSHVF